MDACPKQIDACAKQMDPCDKQIRDIEAATAWFVANKDLSVEDANEHIRECRTIMDRLVMFSYQEFSFKDSKGNKYNNGRFPKSAV